MASLIHSSKNEKGSMPISLANKSRSKTRRADDTASSVTAFTASEVECLAILEHRRWLQERQKAGWRYGTTKDVEAKRSPYLVPWEELPDRAREWNRSAVRSIPSLLASVNLAVVK